MQIFKPDAALSYAAMPDWPPLQHNERQIIRHAVHHFLQTECAMLPWFIATPMVILQILFLSAARCLHHGQSFSSQTEEQQQSLINRWNQCGAPFQALIRLYRSLVMLAYMEHPLVRSVLKLTDHTTQQTQKRAERQALLQQESAP
jgi:hypothetical protein